MKNEFLDQIEQDQADDELKAIVNLKEELTSWLDANARNVAHSRNLSDSVKDLAGMVEDMFDDMYCDEWHRLTALGSTLDWEVKIPSCQDLRVAIKRRKLLRGYPRQVTNPTTLLTVGFDMSAPEVVTQAADRAMQKECAGVK